MTDAPYRFAIHQIRNGYCLVDTDSHEEVMAFVENEADPYAHISNLIYHIGRELVDGELPEEQLSIEVNIKRTE
jgi:hypothetical protein